MYPKRLFDRFGYPFVDNFGSFAYWKYCLCTRAMCTPFQRQNSDPEKIECKDAHLFRCTWIEWTESITDTYFVWLFSAIPFDSHWNQSDERCHMYYHFEIHLYVRRHTWWLNWYVATKNASECNTKECEWIIMQLSTHKCYWTHIDSLRINNLGSINNECDPTSSRSIRQFWSAHRAHVSSIYRFYCI